METANLAGRMRKSGGKAATKGGALSALPVQGCDPSALPVKATAVVDGKKLQNGPASGKKFDKQIVERGKTTGYKDVHRRRCAQRFPPKGHRRKTCPRRIFGKCQDFARIPEQQS